MIEAAKKTVTIERPLDELRDYIKEIVKVGVGKYGLTSENDLFHTYQFSVMDGLNPCIMEVTLTTIEGKTNLEIQVRAANGSIVMPARAATHINEFLNLLSARISGEVLDHKIINQRTSGGCIVLIIVLIICFFLACSKENKECWKCTSVYRKYSNGYLQDSTSKIKDVCGVTQANIDHRVENGNDTVETQANGNFIKIIFQEQCIRQ